MYSFNASSERCMRVSLILVIPLTATVVAGASETTSAAVEVFAGSGAAVTGAALAEGVFATGASFLATVTGSGLLGSMLFIRIPADGFDLEVFAATASTLA